MSNLQRPLVIGMPNLAVLIGLVLNSMWWNGSERHIEERFCRPIAFSRIDSRMADRRSEVKVSEGESPPGDVGNDPAADPE